MIAVRVKKKNAATVGSEGKEGEEGENHQRKRSSGCCLLMVCS